MKSKGTQQDSIHYFFLLTSGVQIFVGWWLIAKTTLFSQLEEYIVTVDEPVGSAFTASVEVIGVIYLLLLCAIIVVALQNLRKT